MVIKSKILGFHPIDIYCAWPSNMVQYTFTKYWKQFSPQQQELKKKTCLGKDKLGFFLYESEHLVWFTNFNLGKHVKPFFFNILLNNVVFLKECELMSPTNSNGIILSWMFCSWYCEFLKLFTRPHIWLWKNKLIWWWEAKSNTQQPFGKTSFWEFTKFTNQYQYWCYMCWITNWYSWSKLLDTWCWWFFGKVNFVTWTNAYIQHHLF
jgi:hypothetical protein